MNAESNEEAPRVGARNIVLTGFMGTGKSTVGKVLAELTERDFVDTDDLIEATHGPISDIFATKGQEAFREMEYEAAQSLADRSGLVIATGGRFMLDPRNAEALGTAAVYCLFAGVDTILQRVLPDGSTRPLLAGDDPRGTILSLLAERAGLYGAFEQVPTDNRTPTDIAQDIAERLTTRTWRP